MPGRSSAHQAHLRRQVATSQPACWLCGGTINYEAHWLDPNSFVIDHVIPIHRDGKDDITNVRAAHRSCNSTKRARLVAPIIRKTPGLNR